MTLACDEHAIDTLPRLEALLGPLSDASIHKELPYVHPAYRAMIAASPFAVLATTGPGGLDASPRGDLAGFVQLLDDKTLLLPERRGNNRADSLRNIVADPRVALLFLIPGVGATLMRASTATRASASRPTCWRGLWSTASPPNVWSWSMCRRCTSSAPAPSSARACGTPCCPAPHAPCPPRAPSLRPSPKMSLTAPPTTANCQRASRPRCIERALRLPAAALPPLPAHTMAAGCAGLALHGLTGRTRRCVRRVGLRGA